MPYQAKIFENLIGLPGFSEKILKDHFGLYQGYVNNFNKLDETLMAMEKERKFNVPEFAELNRRLGWEFNGMRLHELYFGNLSKESIEIDKNSELYGKISKEWESFEAFEKDFRAMAAMRGIGWVILYYDKQADRLFNVWINEHDVGHFSGCAPLLAIDVFEHAYLIDYGTKRADYIDAFMKVIDWKVVEKRSIRPFV